MRQFEIFWAEKSTHIHDTVCTILYKKIIGINFYTNVARTYLLNCFLCCFQLLEKDQIKIFNKISFKKEDLKKKKPLNVPSFDDLNCSPIVHMYHMVPLFQDLPFRCLLIP